jgi:hypothetical protein
MAENKTKARVKRHAEDKDLLKETVEPKKKRQEVVIPPINEKIVEFEIEGTAPYVQLAFSQKAMEQMAAKMKLGSQATKGKKKEARDFEKDYQNAMHVSTEGWRGIPAISFRAAMISACRGVGFQMTKAKLAIFIEQDGFSTSELFPMVKIQGEPRKVIHHVRNQTGVADLRVRAMWDTWKAVVRIRYDADLFSLTDVANLLARAGRFVGIGEGRPDSKSSVGMGWGTFKLAG